MDLNRGQLMALKQIETIEPKALAYGSDKISAGDLITVFKKDGSRLFGYYTANNGHFIRVTHISPNVKTMPFKITPRIEEIKIPNPNCQGPLIDRDIECISKTCLMSGNRTTAHVRKIPSKVKKNRSSPPKIMQMKPRRTPPR